MSANYGYSRNDISSSFTLMDSQKWSVHAVGVQRTGLTKRGGSAHPATGGIGFPSYPGRTCRRCAELPASADPGSLRLPKPFTRLPPPLDNEQLRLSLAMRKRSVSGLINSKRLVGSLRRAGSIRRLVAISPADDRWKASSKKRQEKFQPATSKISAWTGT